MRVLCDILSPRWHKRRGCSHIIQITIMLVSTLKVFCVYLWHTFTQFSQAGLRVFKLGEIHNLCNSRSRLYTISVMQSTPTKQWSIFAFEHSSFCKLYQPTCTTFHNIHTFSQRPVYAANLVKRLCAHDFRTVPFLSRYRLRQLITAKYADAVWILRGSSLSGIHKRRCYHNNLNNGRSSHEIITLWSQCSKSIVKKQQQEQQQKEQVSAVADEPTRRAASQQTAANKGGRSVW